jgi:hypothetical protein
MREMFEHTSVADLSRTMRSQGWRLADAVE